MNELKKYLKELVDEGVIDNDVKDDILYLVKKIKIKTTNDGKCN